MTSTEKCFPKKLGIRNEENEVILQELNNKIGIYCMNIDVLSDHVGHSHLKILTQLKE